MHKSVSIMELNIDEITGSVLKIGEIFNIEHLPVGIAISNGRPDRDSLNKWWIGRSIPASRSGIRDALVVALKFRVNALEKIAALHIKERKAKNHEQSR